MVTVSDLSLPHDQTILTIPITCDSVPTAPLDYDTVLNALLTDTGIWADGADGLKFRGRTKVTGDDKCVKKAN